MNMQSSSVNNPQYVSLGILRRNNRQPLPAFVFVEREGLLVPYRSDDTAELLGEEIYALRIDMQALQPDSSLLTWQDLVGYTITDDEEGPLGTIDFIDEQTINTVATLTDGRMLPLHEDFITNIDTDARILHVKLPFTL